MLRQSAAWTGRHAVQPGKMYAIPRQSGTMDCWFLGFLRPCRPANDCHGSTSLRPVYDVVGRDDCPLLRACWAQDWAAVRRRCRTHPREAFRRTSDSGRTALHLACMPGAGAPADVVRCLLRTNPHAMLVRDGDDRRPGTPFHFLCASLHRADVGLMREVMEVARTVTAQYPEDLPRMSAVSPFVVACQRLAQPATLEALMQGAPHWIAPHTGCESSHLWDCADYESPLSALWDRLGDNFERLDGATSQTIRKVTELLLADRKLSVADVPRVDDDPVIDAWLRILVIIRWGILNCGFSTAVELLSSIHRPVPDLLRLLCQLYPADVQRRTSTGATVLQLLLDQPILTPHDGNCRMIDCVTSIYPGLLLVRDRNTGFVPVLTAAKRNLPIDCVYRMLISSPQAILLQRG